MDQVEDALLPQKFSSPPPHRAHQPLAHRGSRPVARRVRLFVRDQPRAPSPGHFDSGDGRTPPPRFPFSSVSSLLRPRYGYIVMLSEAKHLKLLVCWAAVEQM